jgi:hypothetical protein
MSPLSRWTLCCVLYGAALFWLAPLFVSVRDPFDSMYPILAQAPAFIALAFGLRRFEWRPVLGLFVGEATFPILKGSNLWPLSLIVIAFYLLPWTLAYMAISWALNRMGLGSSSRSSD